MDPSAFFFAAVVAVYGAVILGMSASQTGRRLLVALLVALVPPLLLFLYAPHGSLVRDLFIPMTTGVTFASVIRAAKGNDMPLRGTPPR